MAQTPLSQVIRDEHRTQRWLAVYGAFLAGAVEHHVIKTSGRSPTDKEWRGFIKMAELAADEQDRVKMEMLKEKL